MKKQEKLKEMSTQMWALRVGILDALHDAIKEIVAEYESELLGWYVEADIRETDGVIMTDLEFSDEFYQNDATEAVADLIHDAIESVSPILDSMVGVMRFDSKEVKEV